MNMRRDLQLATLIKKKVWRMQGNFSEVEIFFRILIEMRLILVRG